MPCPARQLSRKKYHTLEFVSDDDGGDGTVVTVMTMLHGIYIYICQGERWKKVKMASFCQTH